MLATKFRFIWLSGFREDFLKIDQRETRIAYRQRTTTDGKSSHRLSARCTWHNVIWSSLSVTCDSSVVFSVYSDFLHQYNWTPLYNWNIVESGVKHHNPNKILCKIQLIFKKITTLSNIRSFFILIIVII